MAEKSNDNWLSRTAKKYAKKRWKDVADIVDEKEQAVNVLAAGMPSSPAQADPLAMAALGLNAPQMMKDGDAVRNYLKMAAASATQPAPIQFEGQVLDFVPPASSTQTASGFPEELYQQIAKQVLAKYRPVIRR